MIPNSIHFNLHNEMCSPQMLVRLWWSLSASGGTCPPLADDAAETIMPPVAERKDICGDNYAS